MNDINQFPFYKNYYELLDNLSAEDKRLMLEVIVDFVFKDIEPNNLEKMNLAIWNNIKIPLHNIKVNILNGQKGGRPKKEENPNNNPNNNPTKNPKRNQNSIFNFYLLILNFKYFNNDTNIINNNNEVNDTNIIQYMNNINIIGKKVKEWLEYKWEKKEYYKETGFKSLLNKIQKVSEEYGQDKVVEIIDESMANNYQGIIFDKLKKQKETSIKKTSTELLYDRMSEWVKKGDEKDNDSKRNV